MQLPSETNSMNNLTYKNIGIFKVYKIYLYNFEQLTQ